MPQRLTAREVSMLAVDTQHTPAHVGTVDLFTASDDFDYEALVALISQRLDFVPRYRMRVLPVPGALAAPVWVDDQDFDLTFHVRRSALPRPGTMRQLQEFVGRVMGRRLDRTRPLWEVYLVEGLADNRFALVTKTHQCLVDGVDAVDIGQVLLDDTPDEGSEAVIGASTWEPAPEPRPVDLVVDAVREGLGDTGSLIDSARRGITHLLGTALAVGEAVGGVGGAVSDLAGSALRGGGARAASPLAGFPSEQRRIAQATMSLAELKKLRMNGRYTVNDVVLAIITGGLRDWLATRGETVRRGELLAMVPMSVIEEDGEPTSLGSYVAPHLIQLPIGESNALMRLDQVSFGTRAHTDTGRAVGARTISDIAGFAPTTLHALGVRVGESLSRRPHDLLITNVPGPQHPLYAGGAPMVASFPVLPLAPGHLLSIGVTSYDGQVFFGLTGDRDAMSDLDVLAQCLYDARDELAETITQAEQARQPTRAAKKPAPKKTAKKTAPKKTAPKKTVTKEAATKNAASGRPAVKKAPAKKTTAAQQAPAAKKTATKTATTRKSSVKKTPATKTPATKKTTAKKTTAKKTTARKTAAKKSTGGRH
ncbi:wax ester/triacylglycerol synthase family O-acyltransferase [Enemella evansiae]|uniref:wax ester/triacylglycerol synthase family O-acyltransferase n=1 Tax=Enemella evansiae TaxID=2016499 RepID=UPI00105B3D41|nr:wax ester/triacylglycerol synthase family O-acyltransferase [Enemella evansiae]TDO93516.1 diacylglycerol O-acyltransferase [Enemella evansiae]